MINNLRLNKKFWNITTFLAFVAATYGLLNNGIYSGLMPKAFIAAQFSQDLLTIIICIFLFYLIRTANERSLAKPIIIVGILGSILYLYAIFSIERVYNVMYLFYLAIFGSSFYSLIFTLFSLNHKDVDKIKVPKLTRSVTAIFSIIVGLIFTFLWISALLPLMKSGNQIDNLYSIYILDLSFVMPAFFITAILTFLKKPFGYILTPAIDIVGIFVIFPLGLGELAKPFFGMTPDYQGMTMSFVLSGLFLFAAAWQLITMKRT